MNKLILQNLKPKEKVFIVDLTSVSIFSPKELNTVLRDEKRYYSTPFLFLLASYNRNETMSWAINSLKYKDKREKGAWTIYCFEYI